MTDMLHAPVVLTMGDPGSGKSYIRASVYLFDEFIPNERGWSHVSNMPIKIDELAKGAAEKYGMEADEIKQRIRLIPKEVELSWQRGESGPWEYFKGQSLQRVHLALDEAHTLCGGGHSKTHRRLWMEFVGEIRHGGGRIEFITQDKKKLAREVLTDCTLEYRIESSETKRDHWFRIPYSHWFELVALFTRDYNPCIWQTECRKRLGVFTVNDQRTWLREPFYYQFYDSYAAPKTGGFAGGEAEQHEFQKRSAFGLIRWFLGKHWGRVLPRLAVVFVLLWVVSGGGGQLIGALHERIARVGMRTQKTGTKKVGSVPASGLLPMPEDGKLLNAYEHRRLVDAVQVAQEQLIEADRVIAVLATELERAEQGLGWYEKRAREAGALRMVSRDECIMADGTVLKAGEVISHGEFAGKRIERIEYEGRRVMLEGGVVLGLALSSWLSQSTPNAVAVGTSEATSVPGPLPEIDGWRGVAAKYRKRAKDRFESRRVGNASDGIPAVSGQ